MHGERWLGPGSQREHEWTGLSSGSAGEDSTHLCLPERMEEGDLEAAGGHNSSRNLLQKDGVGAELQGK